MLDAKLAGKLLAVAGLAAALACAPAETAQLPPQGHASDPAVVQAAAIEAHTAFLASDLLEGRDAGTRGYDLAARYVASQFAAAGLSPAGPNGGWFQPLTVRRRTLEAIDIEWQAGGTTAELVNGDDVALDASPYTTDERLDLEMVFVGWGIDAPALGLDDYAGLDVRGKAVVLLEGGPASLPAAVRAHYSWIQQKERMAAARGAAAVLTLKSPARERFSSWERARRLRPLTAVSWTGARAPGEVLPPRATMTLGPKVAKAIFGRAGHDIDAIYRASETGAPRGFELPGRLRVARRSKHEDAPSANVLGMIPGTDPTLRDEYVVIVSHLDHVGVGPEVNGDRIYNGAVDNAGGVAVMIEVARALKAAPPRRPVLFIATTGEERGLLGSDYYVTYPTLPLRQVVAAISVDGLMAFHDFGGIVALGAEHSTLGEVSARAAQAIGAVHVADPIADRGNLELSDQYPFLRHGIPVLFPNPARGMPRSGPDGIAEWDDYESNHYHQPTDDMKLPLRWDVAARWGDYIRLVIAGAANLDRRPRWYEGDALADVFAPGADRAAPRPGGAGR